MKYHVIVTPEAQDGILEGFEYIEFVDADLRQLIFKSHRIIFKVASKEKQVYVLAARHRKRRAIGETGDD